MPDEPIGSARVDVVADYSKLSQGFQAAQGEAAKAGASIASSFQQAAGPASGLESAVNRIVAVIQQESAAATLATQRNLALSGARGAAAGAAEDHARATRHEITEIQGTSAAIRTLEGNAGLRAVENFLAKTLGLGSAFKAIFPIVGAIAFFEILGHIGEKLFEIFSASPLEKARGEFAELDRSVELTNDALQVTNDKLDNQIAKLTGRHQNTLKLMLDEAKESADKLAESLTKGLSALYGVLKQNEPGFFARLTGTAGTGDITKSVGGNTGFGGPNKEVEAISAQGRLALDGAKTLDDKNRIIKDTNDRIIGVFDEQIKTNEQKLRDAEAELARRKNPALQLGGVSLTGASGASRETAPTKDTETRIELLSKTIRNLEAQKQTSLLSTEAGPKKDAATGLEAQRTEAQEQYRLWEDELARKKAIDAVTLSEETAFWTEKRSRAIAGGAAHIDVVRSIDTKLGTLHQEAVRRSIAEGNRSESETLHEIEQQIKAVQIAAEDAGGSPAAVKLKFLVDVAGPDAPDTGLSADNQKKLAAQIPDAQHAANKEATANLRRMLAEQDQAWLESGIRTAGELKQRAEIARNALEELRPFFVGIDELIDTETAKIIAANKRLEAEKLKVADLVARNQEAGGQTEIASRRIALESAYGLQVVHTYQQQISYQQQLAGLEAESLKLKQGLADEEYRAAVASRDAVRIQEALNAQAAAGAAIELQAQKAAADLAKLKKDQSFSGQLASGLSADAQSAVSRLSSGIATLATQTKGWGQEFKNILKEIERSIIETFATSALKQGLNTLLSAGKAVSGGGSKGGGQMGAEGGMAFLAALTANTAATSTDAAVTTTHTGIMSSHLGVMVSHLGAMISNTAAAIANTIVIIAQTLATWALAAVETIKAFFGFAAGGNPDPNQPFIAGENGPELIHPKGRSLTVVTADKTRQMLAAAQQGIGNFQIPQGSLDIPQVAPSATISASRAHSISSSSASAVNNHNTGNIGTAHFNIYESRNPRQTVREIASYMKLSSPKFSPANS